MSWLTILEGAAEIGAGAALDIFAGGAGGLGNLLIGAGVGSVISGVGSLIAGDPVRGFATTTRNPIAPWTVCYGQARPKGTVVYIHTWGNNDQMLDLVIVLAGHSCQSIDELLFDQQRVQIDTTAVPTSASAGYTLPWAVESGSGTSFTPVQQTINITSIARANDVVTVVIPQDIPYLQSGDQIKIQNISGDYTLNGTFQVAEIISRVPSGGTNILTFTYLSGGSPSIVDSEGQAVTLWANYARNVYMEVLTGNQPLGQTFVGMTAGTPWQGTGKLCTPASPQQAGGAAAPNPWTNYCSLQGKTAVFLRLTYNSTYFGSGLPQISFHVSGKNDIYDPRLGAYGAGGGTATLGIDGIYPDVNSGGKFNTLNIYVGGIYAAIGGTITIAGTTGGVYAGSYTVTENPGPGGAITVAAVNALTATGYVGPGTLTYTIPATTGYTSNAALCIADFLTNQTFGYKFAYGTDVPLAALETAANTCDTAVALAAGGTEPMYSLNGQFDLSMKRGEILDNLLTACAGRRVELEGQQYIVPGSWAGPGNAVNLTAMASGPFVWRPTSSIRDLYNGCKGTYISPENKWQSTDFPYYAQDSEHGYSGPSMYDGDINLAADGGDRRWLELHLPFTISPSTAQRIAKIELLRRRNGATGTFPLNMAGYQFAPLDIIQATVPALAFSGETLEILKVRLKLDTRGKAPLLSTEIDVQATNSDIYVWSTEEELTPQGYVQTRWPAAQITETVSRPWSPGYVSPLAGDAIGGAATFGLQPVYGVDAQGNATLSLQIKGTPPINALDETIAMPQLNCVPLTTGGSLPDGEYVVGYTAWDSGASTHGNSDYLNLAHVVVSGGGGSGSIGFTVIEGSGDDGGDIYVAAWNGLGSYVFHYNQTLASTVTTGTITAFNQSTPGGPDGLFDHFAATWRQEVHAGVWADQINALTATTITIGANGMTANQWAGYALSLLAKYSPSVEIPVINMPIASSTASSGGLFTLTIGPNALGVTLPDLTTLLAPLDVVVMRGKYTFTANSFTDPNVANGFYPSGATAIEAGHVAVVLSGADQGDVQTISSVTTDGFGNYTVFNLSGSWEITPATGDIVVICLPSEAPEVLSASISAKNASVSGVMIQPNVQNLPLQAWLFLVRTEDVNGVSGPDSLAPMRELYLFGGAGTLPLAMLSVSGTLAIQADACPAVYLPAASTPSGAALYVKQAPAGAALNVSLWAGSTLWLSLSIPAASYQVVITPALCAAAGPIPANTQLRLSIDQVGTTSPGSDLSLFLYR